MATRDVRARIALDGEKEYKAALSDISKGNQVLNSEMKKLQAQFKGNTESTEFLTKKGDLLQRQLSGQREKVELLRKQLLETAQAEGEASKKTMDLQIRLNNAEAAEFNLQHAIDENSQALQNNGQQMVSLGDVADQLAGKLGIRIPEGAKKALDGMKGMSAGSVAALGAITAAVAAAVKGISELHRMTVEAAADIDELVTQSMISGLSTQTLQQLQYASEFVDVSVETMTGSMTKLTSAMAKARDGNDTTAAAFADLGVSITDIDGNLRSAEDVFYEVIDALGEIQNPTERDAAAMELLGKSAQDLNPLILEGSDALRQLGKEAEDVGYVLGSDDVEALAALDDAVQRNQLQWEALKKELAAQFAPASTSALEAFTQLTKTAGEALVNSHLIENLGSIIQAIAGMMELGTDLASALPGWVNPLSQVSAAFKGLAVVIATVVDAMKVLIGLTPAFWGSGMLRSGLGLGDSPSNLQQVLGYGGSGAAVSYGNLDSSLGYDAASGRYYNLSTGNYVNAPGTDYWRGGMTWVGENGPELVSLPRGSSIMSASESAGAMGAQYIMINVQGIEQLDEVVRWYESRRVTERMR